MLVILIENRNTLKNFRQILLIGLASLSYGIIIEIMQSTLTVTRTGDFFDALADLTGISAAILIWFLVMRYKKQAFRY
jgi:VanZ family protein